MEEENEWNECVEYFRLFNVHIADFSMKTICFKWMYKWDSIYIIIKTLCCSLEFDLKIKEIIIFLSIKICEMGTFSTHKSDIFSN